jgi:hypothetical protein
MKENENPESLHQKGAGKEMKTESAFVNPGTPDAPLVKREDLPNPVVSSKGTQALRSNLIKDNGGVKVEN